MRILIVIQIMFDIVFTIRIIELVKHAEYTNNHISKILKVCDRIVDVIREMKANGR